MHRADREGLVRWVGEREGRLDRPSAATIELPDGSIAISDPAWWAEHVDVLVDGLQRELGIGRQSEPLLDLDASLDRADQERSDPEPLLDLDAALDRADQERPEPEPLIDLDAALDRAQQQPPDSERPRDRGIER